jgi:C1A family cysteine protease
MARVSALPSSVDLELWCGPVKDQGQLGACTAFAGCGMLEFLFRKYGHALANPVLSPMFLYYVERKIDGTLAEGDCGSSGRTLVQAINRFGVCLESGDIYSPSNFEVAPTPAQSAEAQTMRAGAYHRIGCVDDMKSCLASGYAFVVTFVVRESFETNLGADGTMPMPNKGKELILGAHEVLFIGYDDAKQAFKVRNSWSASWGVRGNFWFPYAAAADPEILFDAWIQHFGGPW